MLLRLQLMLLRLQLFISPNSGIRADSCAGLFSCGAKSPRIITNNNNSCYSYENLLGQVLRVRDSSKMPRPRRLPPNHDNNNRAIYAVQVLLIFGRAVYLSIYRALASLVRSQAGTGVRWVGRTHANNRQRVVHGGGGVANWSPTLEDQVTS